VNIQQVIIGTAFRRFAGRDSEATTSLQLARIVGVAKHAVFYHCIQCVQWYKELE
jgi:AcrR family transcriptional regulator